MSGYLYGEAEPAEACPYCSAQCSADFVDIGVGMTQCGPFHCQECGASQIGAYDNERPLSDEEKRLGWYAPGAEPGSSANVIGGAIVGHKEALEAYKTEFTGNELWYDRDAVSEWWFKNRKRS